MESLNYMSIRRLLFFLLIVVVSVGCESEYQQYVERELASGIRNDSLIFDMWIGQTRKDFYDICWQLNKQKLVREGTGNRTARHTTDMDAEGNKTLESKDLLFYGIFDENDIMRGMDMTYSYLTWAPWNKDRQADKLLLRLREQYEKDYPGNDFIEIDIKDLEYPALVKIDGNRQILMYPKNEKDVVVKIEDLNYKLNKQWKKD